MSPHPQVSPSELVLEACVHPFRCGALVVSPTLGMLIADRAPGGGLPARLLLALRRAAGIAVDDRNMAQGRATAFHAGTLARRRLAGSRAARLRLLRVPRLRGAIPLRLPFAACPDAGLGPTRGGLRSVAEPVCAIRHPTRHSRAAWPSACTEA